VPTLVTISEEAIDGYLHKYKLYTKVQYIITDNAINMCNAFSVLRDSANDAALDMAGVDGI